MGTIGDAVAAFGIADRDGEDIVVAEITGDGILHHRLAKARRTEPSADRDWYIAGGGFRPGSVTATGGRTRENLLSVRILSFDFDLDTWLDEPKEAILATGTADLRDLAQTMRLQVERIAREIGLPLHVIAYTGHGLLGVTRIAAHDADALETILAAYKGIVARINAVAGSTFADPAVSDGGTRLIRMPGTYNVKGCEPRAVEVWHDQPGEVSVVELVAIGGEAGATRSRSVTPQPVPVGELDAETFRRLVDLASPYWRVGVRNELAKGVPASFVKAGVGEAQAMAFLDAMPDQDEAVSRRATCRRTYYMHAQGRDISGYHVLANVFPPDVLTVWDTILEGVRQSQGVKLRAPGPSGGGRRDRAESFRVTPFPEEAWYPGWFTEYRDLVGPLTEAPPQYHLGSALVLVSATIGRKARLDVGGGLYPSLYALLIGPSGSARKDTAMRLAVSLPGLAEAATVGGISVPSFSLKTDIASAEALVSMLAETPTILAKLSEINALLANAQRKGTRTLLDKLIEAFDAPLVLEIQSIRARSEKAAAALAPFLAIIAAAQPGRFGDMITDEDIHSGFLNRWLFIPGIGGDPLALEGTIDATVAVGLYQRLRRSVTRYDGRRALQLTTEAQSLNTEWYRRIRATMGRDEAEDAMRQRHQVIALKVATIYAVAEEADVVTADHLRAAIALVEWSWANVRQYMQLWGVSPTHKLERRILDVLEQTGPISRRVLQQKTASRRWTGYEFGRAVSAMLANGTLGVAGNLVGIADDAGEVGDL